MIIRASKKLLNISGINPITHIDDSTEILPGDWYANILKTGYPGKLVILFFHNKTKISIICPTKSLNIALKQFPEKVKSYLIRHRFDSLIDKFKLDSEIQIFTTESKSTLAYMNQLSSNIEWHLSKSKSFEKINYSSIEDIHSGFLFSIDGKSGKYEKPIEILNRIKALESNL
jgi:hypothetical protein